MKEIRYTDPARLELSDETGGFRPVESLVWAKTAGIRFAGQNQLLYSSYNVNGWTSTAVDEGTISLGFQPDRQIVHYASGGTTTLGNGTQTWSGSGILTSGSITIDGVSSQNPTDCTGWKTACFSLWLGPYQCETTPGGTWRLGVYRISDDTELFFSTGSFKGMCRRYVSGSVAGETEIYAKLTVTATGEWWADGMQLESDTSEPGKFYATSGAAVVQTLDQKVYFIQKVEEDKTERVVEPWEYHGIPKGDPQYPQVTRTKFNGR